MNKTSWREVTEAELAAQFGKRLVRTPTGPVPATERPTMKTSRRFDYADTLKQQIALVGLPEPIRDHRFDPIRRWLMDLAWPVFMVSCEVDGNEWAQTNGKRGRHGGGKGMQSDCEKLNAALLAGWKPYRFTGSQVQSGYALGILEKALRAVGSRLQHEEKEPEEDLEARAGETVRSHGDRTAPTVREDE